MTDEVALKESGFDELEVEIWIFAPSETTGFAADNEFWFTYDTNVSNGFAKREAIHLPVGQLARPDTERMFTRVNNPHANHAQAYLAPVTRRATKTSEQVVFLKEGISETFLRWL